MRSIDDLRSSGLVRIAARVSEEDRGFTTPCWIGDMYRDRDGYCVVTFRARPQRLHRVTYAVLVGPIPEGLQIDHLCRVRSCVNPDHLEAVTSAENTLRGNAPTARHARKTHCKWGHEFTPENTHIRPGGGRRCRACRRRDHREESARRRSLSAA